MSTSSSSASPLNGDWRQEKSAEKWRMLNPDDETTDVKFLVGADEQEILAHRVTLMQESKEFHHLLLPRQDYYYNPIKVVQYQPQAFMAFLKYIYHGNLPSAEDDAYVTDTCGILKVAKDFQPDIVPLCKSGLENKIKSDWKIALKALELTDEEDAEIIFIALNTICPNFNEIVSCPEFLQLPLNNLMKLFKQDELNVAESHIFEAVIRWAENRIGDVLSMNVEEVGLKLRTEIGDLLYLIRFPLMEADYFLKKVAELKILDKIEHLTIATCLLYASQSNYYDPAPFSCKRRQNINIPTEEASSINTSDNEFAEALNLKVEQRPDILEKGVKSTVEPKHEVKYELSDSDDDEMSVPKEPPKKIQKMMSPVGEIEGSPNNSISSEEIGGNALFEDSLDDPIDVENVDDNTTPMELNGSPIILTRSQEFEQQEVQENMSDTMQESTTSSSRSSEISTDATTVIGVRPRKKISDTMQESNPSSSRSRSSKTPSNATRAIEVTPGEKILIKENSWLSVSSEDPIDWTVTHENLLFIQEGMTYKAYCIQPPPTNEPLKYQYSITGDENSPNEYYITGLLYPPARAGELSPVLFALHGSKLSVHYLHDGSKIVDDLDFSFFGRIAYMQLDVLDEYIYVDYFCNRVDAEGNELDEVEGSQEILVLKYSQIDQQPLVELVYRILFPGKLLGEYVKISRVHKKLFVEYRRRMKVYSIEELINENSSNSDEKKVIRKHDQGADKLIYSKHPNLTTIIIKTMPKYDYKFHRDGGVTPLPSKTCPLHILFYHEKKDRYAVFSEAVPKKPIRTFKAMTATDEIAYTTSGFDHTVPYLMCYYKSSGFILMKANEPGSIQKAVLTSSHVFPLENKGRRKKKPLTKTKTDKSMRWPKWKFQLSSEYEGKIGICSMDQKKKIIHISIHNTADFKKDFQKLPQLKIEDWGLPADILKDMEISVTIHKNFVQVFYGRDSCWRSFIYAFQHLESA